MFIPAKSKQFSTDIQLFAKRLSSEYLIPNGVNS